MIEILSRIFPDSFTEIKILVTIGYFLLSLLIIFLNRKLIYEIKILVIYYIIGLIGGYIVIDDLLLPENPRVCIDNYSGIDVKVYLNDYHFIDVITEDEFSLSYNSTLPANKFFGFKEGDYILYIKDNKDNILQEINIETKNNQDYILNVLNKVRYEEGVQSYGKSITNSYKSQHSKDFFIVDKDYYFTELPESIKVHRTQNSDEITYIKRDTINHNFIVF